MTLFLILNLQLSGVQAFINLSIIAILSHALERGKKKSILVQCSEFMQTFDSVFGAYVGRCVGQISFDRV